MPRTLLALLLFLGVERAAAQDWEVSLYSGLQGAEDSRVGGDDPGGVGSFGFVIGWEGDSFVAPPYFGLRATRWLSETAGLALDLNHAKVYADAGVRTDEGFQRLEFSDGLNVVTLNSMRRFPGAGRWTPYVGVGAGLAVPHVEVTTAGSRTSGYQVTGPAVVAIVGLSNAMGREWSLFGEYKGSQSWNRARLEGGGRLETDIRTHALNVGFSLRF